MTSVTISDMHDALQGALANFRANPNHAGSIAWLELSTALARYEATGDHDHEAGFRPIKPGGCCPGGDCLVHEARKALYVSLGRSLGISE